MKHFSLRLILAVIVAEAIPIILLIALVVIFGPGEAIADEAYAVALGRWVGSIGGALATLVMALWAVRVLPAHHLRFGALTGLLVAGLDASILAVSGASFEWLFIASGAGRVLAGSLGGFLASRNKQYGGKK